MKDDLLLWVYKRTLDGIVLVREAMDRAEIWVSAKYNRIASARWDEYMREEGHIFYDERSGN